MWRLAAVGVLALHLGWILWVIFGCLVTKGRPRLAALHVVSLLYSIAIETGPWPCPLTRWEQAAQARAGLTPYEQDFLVHYLEAVIYPGVPPALLAAAAVAVCAFNLAVYLWRWRRG
jgi:hypothetical protein